MLETQGRVIAVEAGFAWVESVRQSGCGSCASKGACGSQLLGEALAPSSSNQALNRVRAQDALGVQVGDTVVLGVAEEGALRAAFLIYGLPLLGLLLGVLLAQPWGDLWAMVAGMMGLGLAMGVVWLLGRSARHESRASNNLQPQILARIASAPLAADAARLNIIPIQKLH
ncbi:MAG: hypothetical protein B7Y40_02970 [Gammaproteobacteria bacterium 28-57-27]|nr:MAG: hypothetical protein B7Y40_02970 [Gammaproteobacteria bacterium 28-57-27]